MKYIYCAPRSKDNGLMGVAADPEFNIDLTCFAFKDFAGSGVVHICAGTCALVACYFMGPRRGRFAKDKSGANEMQGHSVPLTGLGGFILLFGFLAFNGGSQVKDYMGSVHGLSFY